MQQWTRHRQHDMHGLHDMKRPLTNSSGPAVRHAARLCGDELGGNQPRGAVGAVLRKPGKQTFSKFLLVVTAVDPGA